MAACKPQIEKGRDNYPCQGNGKVLFIASVYTHLAAFHTPFMKLLQEKGYEVYAAASSAEGHKEDVEAEGVTCWEVPFTRSPYGSANVLAYRRLRALLKEHRFDLIHVHTPVAAFLGRYLAKTTHQGPVLYTAHGFHFYKGAPRRNWLIYYNAERLAAPWTDGLIVMNGEDFDNARRLGFEAGKNLFYVHGVGVDLSKFSTPVAEKGSVRATLGIDSDDVVITCVAELNDNKNQAFLIDAWRKFIRRYGHGHLLLVGTGEKMVVLQQRVEQERIPRVHFLGYRSDVPQILRETDIVTLVSKREGLPKSIMEAMAAGKPVVATNVRGNRDLVEHGKTGLLVELGDVDGLAAAIEKLVSNPEQRAAMGAAGREKIKEYSLEKVLAEMAAIYNRYLK
ncbi:glycosyl transferase group 1 [Desulfofundulus kuznetsovii DSM 6115]|uniref:Glycosyl transferase group 1 n=1 Tax=Desulfofundulus kuznetsovii (strain DSM 6115 / VKM B-1805 / 17) TaxID=760568 RepID=A0AAU8PQ73_DESK7|nr:glycosyl transferase group 1 [Desulfofundulus kuznetsovii DSM 6115]